ncbi:hypothetical protein Dvina_17415 [Dactylosporangium vinaceum]|uniref:Uncharacterized protein n=1 Tax=Dactylosporangium vinaceum TaxID=53362 RepID=A0ABV5M3G2_9ACTN|nr:hypothetical protein [Dactylosporangium vinaceum]UAB99685.1 hypothetical protein Dvina_17415 [Dactylosporangium vinaceum]
MGVGFHANGEPWVWNSTRWPAPAVVDGVAVALAPLTAMFLARLLVARGDLATVDELSTLALPWGKSSQFTRT